jgi:hypothetical protein
VRAHRNTNKLYSGPELPATFVKVRQRVHQAGFTEMIAQPFEEKIIMERTVIATQYLRAVEM